MARGENFLRLLHVFIICSASSVELYNVTSLDFPADSSLGSNYGFPFGFHVHLNDSSHGSSFSSSSFVSFIGTNCWLNFRFICWSIIREFKSSFSFFWFNLWFKFQFRFCQVLSFIFNFKLWYCNLLSIIFVTSLTCQVFFYLGGFPSYSYLTLSLLVLFLLVQRHTHYYAKYHPLLIWQPAPYLCNVPYTTSQFHQH